MYIFKFLYIYDKNNNMNIGIYKITSPVGKIYVGQSVDLKKREKDYKKLKCWKQHKIYNSLKKYGPENHKFEILEECTLEQLNEKEIYWGMQNEVLGENGLNLKLGTGKGALSKETKQKIRLSRINHPNLNLPVGENHRSAILTEHQVIKIYSLIKKYYSNNEIIKKLDLPIQSGTITNLRYGITWNHLWHQYFNYPYPGFPSKKNGVSFRIKIKIIEFLDKGYTVENISKLIKRVNKYDIKYAYNKKIWKSVWSIYEYLKNKK
jgi:group I intron endonuclease